MLERLTKGLDEAFHGIRKAASKVTLRAEEQARLTRLNLRVKTMTRDLDKVMARLGKRLYALRQAGEQTQIFQDGELAAAAAEADHLTQQMESLRKEMERIREDYALRLQAQTPVETAAVGSTDHPPPDSGKE